MFFRIGYPHGPAGLYPAVSFPLLLAGAAAVFFIIKMVDLSSLAAQWGIELGFALAVALFVGFTLPQKSGAPPLSQLLRGEHPTQAAVREGVSKLGLAPESAPARFVIGLFPTH